MFLRHRRLLLLALALVLVPCTSGAQTTNIAPTDLALHGVTASVVTYKGRRATRLVGDGSQPDAARRGLALLRNASFRDGTIEVWVAGAPAAASQGGSRWTCVRSRRHPRWMAR